MAKSIPVRMDDKGRLMVPKGIREALHAGTGDVFYIQQEPDGSMKIIKGGDPFDELAIEAIREDDEGGTMSFDNILHREGISLDE